DLPMEVPEDLPLIAFSKREAAEDVLVLPKDGNLDETKPIGSSSPRRTLQLEALFPGMEQKSVRGNVLTRLEKLDGGEYSCLVLAKAGLRRLSLDHRISREFTPEEMVPAAGQGIMVVQGRAGEDYSYLDGVDDQQARIEATAERALVARLEGGCSSPIGAFAQLKGEGITIRGFYSDEEKTRFVVDEQTGPKEDAIALAVALADKLKGAFHGDEQ
ncbi:MAG: hydroxymethylbilane synthase, partial [Anaerovoracaceae bacterium]